MPLNAPAPAAVKPGHVGMLLAAGEVVATASGRATTPFPRLALQSDRQLRATLKRTQRWLLENAAAEAQALGNDFARAQFERALPGPQQADLDAAEAFLFPPAPIRAVR